MENEQLKLEALRVLNEHFKHEGKLEHLEDRQVKLVLDAMIEFRQFGVIKSVCQYEKDDTTAMNCKHCGKAKWLH